MVCNNRKLWLDALRGVAMLLVVYGHCVQEWTGYFVFTSPVKMPLFFIISGYLFKQRDGNQKKFFKSIFLKLIIPWMVFGLFPYIFIHPTLIGERVYSLVSGKVLWFMPCLIIAEIIWFYVLKFTNSFKWVVIAGLLVSSFGFFLSANHLLRFAMIDTAFIVQAFFVVGYLLKRYESIIKTRKTIIILVLLMYIGIGLVTLYYYPGESLDVHVNKYYNIPICAVMIVLGCGLLFSIFRQRPVEWKWLVYIGQNTLLIYMLHGYGLSVASRVLPIANEQIGLPLLALIKTIIACVLCCILAIIVNRYIPQIVGKKK